MPAGILTVSLRSRVTRPAPRQVVHGFVMTRPVPRHCGQVRATVKKPCWNRTCPWPRHCGHVLGVGARRRARSAAGLAALLPRNLDGGLGAARRFLERDLEVVAEIGAALRPAAPAAAAEQVAEAEHVAEDVGEVAELGEDRRVEPGARAGGRARRRRGRSDRRGRASRGRPGSAYASAASLNFSSAALSPGLRSGWYFIASLRYALFSSTSVAVRATPRTS